MLKGKKIILGITGSIAAYKAAQLTRFFVTNGASVKIIVTPYAKEFITPVTLATLSKNTVLCDFFHHDDGSWNSHVDLGLWADLFVVAPATANTMAKMAHGICDNLLLTTYMSARCPVMMAPAMDLDMYKHPATQSNIKILKSFGNIIVEPSSGELASGLIGKGRMEDPEKILAQVVDFFSKNDALNGKKFLVTAGPTYEAIDPVRFIGNHSSGKMGFAVAENLAKKGAVVYLITGPVHINTSHPKIIRTNVVNADQMYDAVMEHVAEVDGIIMSAAVADFKPVKESMSKIKKDGKPYVLELTNTKDIALEVSQKINKKQIFVGFALETDNEIEHARSKQSKKNFDFIVLNSLNDEGAGFMHDTNKITIIDKSNNIEKFELKSKELCAEDIVRKIIEML
jgi:phosphopantothenoylcysteine decarboxylase / phosphopantothenate---cysteine ligase